MAAVLFAVSCPELGAAGQGWYLIVPPVGQEADGSDIPILAERTAMRHWQTVRAFDSAKECEVTKDVEMKEALAKAREFLHAKDPMQKWLSSVSTVWWLRYMYGRCVASDDPRLSAGR